MKTKFRFLTSTIAIIAGLGVFSTLAPTADAQRARRASDEPAPAEGRQFSAKAGEVVNEALQLMNGGQNAAAVSKLNEALAIPDLNAYERSTIYQMRAAPITSSKIILKPFHLLKARLARAAFAD